MGIDLTGLAPARLQVAQDHPAVRCRRRKVLQLPQRVFDVELVPLITRVMMTGPWY